MNKYRHILVGMDVRLADADACGDPPISVLKVP